MMVPSYLIASVFARKLWILMMVVIHISALTYEQQVVVNGLDMLWSTTCMTRVHLCFVFALY